MFLPSWMVMDERVQAHTHSCFYYVRRQSAEYVIAGDENQCGFQPDWLCVVVLSFKKVVTIYNAPSKEWVHRFPANGGVGGWRMLFREGETSYLQFVLPFIVLIVGGLNDVLIFFPLTDSTSGRIHCFLPSPISSIFIFWGLMFSLWIWMRVYIVWVLRPFLSDRMQILSSV